jgi:hypothetical protein
MSLKRRPLFIAATSETVRELEARGSNSASDEDHGYGLVTFFNVRAVPANQPKYDK